MPRTRTAIAAIVALTGAAQAGYVINVDTDPGAGFALNPQVTFGGDTTTASQSVAQSGAFGASGGHLFGGNGALEPDTYVFTYSPDAQADNLVIPQGTDLGNGVLASGLAGGDNGAYSVYATWPFTTNVSGGLVNFTVETGIDSFQVSLDQNNTGDIWVFLGNIDYDGGAITVTQSASSNTFVSMRSAGVLFELVPTPGTASLLLVAGIGARRRRSA